MTQSFAQEVDTLLRARVTLMVLSTVEEPRAVEAISRACQQARRECYAWDLPSGFTPTTGRQTLNGGDPVSALEQNCPRQRPHLHRIRPQGLP